MIYEEHKIKDFIIKSIQDNSRFLLYYQPIYSTQKKEYTKTEVLLRMLDDENKIVMPDSFIPYSEKFNFINEIGYIVIDKLCKFLNRNRKLSDIKFSINISPVQLKLSGFADKALEIIKNNNIKTSQIIFELTESVPYSFDDTVKENILKIHDNGIKISLDDMGKGSSDLNKANFLPIEYIKIDKNYIDNLENERTLKMIKTLILFSKSKKVETVAEGVETVNQMNILEKLKCEYLQGYYFSKPVPEKDFIQIVDSQKRA